MKLILISTLIFFSCEDEIQTWELIPNLSHEDVGIITIIENDTVIDTLHTSANVEDGTSVSVLAIPIEDGWEFDHWLGSIESNDNPHTFLMDDHKEITAVFSLLKYPLSIEILGDGEVNEEILLSKTTTYDHGSQVKLTAVPNTGWEFDHWEGDISGNINPDTVYIDYTKNIKAIFKIKTYPLNLIINGEGSVNEEKVIAKTTDYDHGSQIKLTAVPNIGWEFDHWEGDLTGNINPEIITMDTTKSITTFFEKIPYSLNIDITGNGSVTKAPNSDEFYYGDTVSIAAIPNQGWEFDHWEGDITGNANPEVIVIDSTKSVTALFEKIPYSINVSVNGNGSITKIPNNNEFYYGDTISIVAVPETGWAFSNWQGDISGDTNPYTLVVTEDKNIEANFTSLRYEINISKIGNGAVQKVPDKEYYNYNEEATLTALPDSGWSFNKWSNGISSTTNPITFNVTENLNISAEFNQLYSLNISQNGSGTVNVNPQKDLYNYGDIVQLTANPYDGWEFNHWEGDISGFDNPIQIEVNKNTNVSAVFQKTDYITENVIIVVMDGARYSESWGDPSHQNIPYMANYMSSEGVINTNFYNMEETITTSGHIYMTTGVYQVKEGKSKDYPYYPSIFQHWIKDNTNTSNKAWVIASKDKLEALGNCNLDNWENKYLPNTDCGINGAGTGYRDDSITYTKTINVLTNYKPNLVLVNFREPDVSGHTGVWNSYVQSIKTTDEYIYKIWNFINTNPNYKGKTTMFVTNDHGRHLDGVGTGFKDHGCGCDGCRHVYLYAFGPDFKKGIELNNKRELIDIPATVSELLDFNLPYGQGKVMTELFK